MNSDEALNRIITALIETHLGRLQVELYKTIKREAVPVRTLRAALSKFADLAHMVKPLKRRIFVESLLPSLERIMRMDGESIQETLAGCMGKLCSALGLFFTDAEVQELLALFVENTRSRSVVIRRTATECGIAICLGTATPYVYLTLFSNNLFGQFDLCQGPGEDAIAARLGALLGFRRILLAYQSVSRTVRPRQRLYDAYLAGRLLQMLLDSLDDPMPNIVTASLEALQEFFKVLDGELLAWFRQPEVCNGCMLRIAAIILGEAAVRVSVRALALSCLTTTVLHNPAGLRLRLPEGGCTVSDAIPRFIGHSDPMVRGNVYRLVAHAVSSSIELQEHTFAAVPPVPSDAADGAECPDAVAARLQLDSLCRVLADALIDDTSTAARQGCQAVRSCLSAVLASSRPEYGLELLGRLLTLRDSSYWLISTEILSAISELDFVLLAHVEATVPKVRPVGPEGLFEDVLVPGRRNPLGAVQPMQQRVLDFALGMLGAGDGRVREAAATCLVQLAWRMYHPGDYDDQSALTALAEQRTTALLLRHECSDEMAGPDDDALAAAVSKPSSTEIRVCRGNLSRIASRVVARMHASQERNVLIGCYHALDVLSSKDHFPDSVRLEGGGDGGGLHRRTSCPLSMDDMLPLTLDHLCAVPWMSLELSAHISMLGLVGNLSRDAPANGLKPYTVILLGHVLRVLNICVHITTAKAPRAPPKSGRDGRSSVKKGKARAAAAAGGGGDGEAASPREQRTSDALEDGIHSGQAAPPGASRGYFAHLPHYLKLHDTLKGAYDAGTITLAGAEETSKFGNMCARTRPVIHPAGGLMAASQDPGVAGGPRRHRRVRRRPVSGLR